MVIDLPLIICGSFLIAAGVMLVIRFFEWLEDRE